MRPRLSAARAPQEKTSLDCQQAKPYQVRQFMKLVERYNLQLEDGA
jgi:hypothetical protein